MDPQQRLLLQCAWRGAGGRRHRPGHAGRQRHRCLRRRHGQRLGPAARWPTTRRSPRAPAPATAAHPRQPALVPARPARPQPRRRHGLLLLAGRRAPGRERAAVRRMRHGAGRRGQPGAVPDAGTVYRAVRARAPDGRCKPFDAEADGIVPRRGRRRRRAASGWRTRAPTATPSERRLPGHAPSTRTAAATASPRPSGARRQGHPRTPAGGRGRARTVGYVEAHGTGTALGDLIEAARARRRATAGRRRASRCAHRLGQEQHRPRRGRRRHRRADQGRAGPAAPAGPAEPGRREASNPRTRSGERRPAAARPNPLALPRARCPPAVVQLRHGRHQRARRSSEAAPAVRRRAARGRWRRPGCSPCPRAPPRRCAATSRRRPRALARRPEPATPLLLDQQPGQAPVCRYRVAVAAADTAELAGRPCARPPATRGADVPAARRSPGGGLPLHRPGRAVPRHGRRLYRESTALPRPPSDESRRAGRDRAAGPRAAPSAPADAAAAAPNRASPSPRCSRSSTRWPGSGGAGASGRRR